MKLFPALIFVGFGAGLMTVTDTAAESAALVPLPPELALPNTPGPTSVTPDVSLPAIPPPVLPRQPVEPERIIQLPPMIISETSKASPWLYVATEDTEYLSRCSQATTRAFVTAQLEIRQILQLFIPADFFAKSAVPAVSILAPLDTNLRGDDAVGREMLRNGNQPPRPATPNNRNKNQRQRKGSAPEGFRFLPNLRLDDRDMLAVFSYINERTFRAENVMAAPEYISARLASRTPTLPAWLLEGVTRLYPQGNFRRQPLTIQPVRWLSAEDTAGLQRDPESRRVMLSAHDLFSIDALAAPENQHPTRVAAWQSQAALFVRWALDPAHAPAAEALWTLARRVSHEPPTEALFLQCFGFGYADLQERLSDYLPIAVRQPVRLPTVKLPALPRLQIKPATPEQIARLRGEWERLEIPFVRARHPEFLPRYIDQARATLRRGVDRGDQDPRLYAALGLCELDAGDPAAARPYLEKAAAAQVIRPRVYYELARLRWLDLLRDVPENGGFTVAELQPILEPLRVAATLSPPLPEVYILMADAWLRCRDRVRSTDLPGLVAATPLFRRIPGVAYRVALLQLREGQQTEASELLKLGVEFASEPSMKANFQHVLTAITAAAKPTGETK